jgi:Domain of Unknown Function with PDB structure (DUF3857)/Transglutaminase-like superfamily
MRRDWLLWLLLTGAFGCATTRVDFAPVDWGALPTAEQYPGEPVVVLVDALEVGFSLDGEEHPQAVTVERRSIMALQGIPADTWSTHYWPEFERVDMIEVRITPPGGKPYRLGAKDRFDAPERSGGGILFTQHRVMGFRAPPLAAGSVLEFVVQKTGSRPELGVEQQLFASGRPTLRVELSATAVAGFSIEHRIIGEADPAIGVSDDVVDGKQVVHYVRTNLPARLVQDDEPSPWLWWPRVLLRIGKYRDADVDKHSPTSAAEVSRLEHALSHERTKPSESIVALHGSILAALPASAKATPRQRAQALYTWVQGNIQYCALYESALGGFVPHPAAAVVEQRSGDCKDKAALLSSLLQVDGTPNRLAVIFSHDGYPHRYEIPALFHNFNHMIIIVDLPDGEVIADPTSRSIPFGSLPASDQGTDLLPISEAGDDIIVTAIDAPKRNRIEIDYQLSLVDGVAAGSVRVVFTGAQAARIRVELMSTPVSQHAERMAEHLALPEHALLAQLRLEGLTYDGTDSPVVAVADVSQLPIVLGANTNRPLVAVKTLLFDGFGALPSEAGGPLLMAERGEVVIRADITVPAAWRIVQIPTAQQVDNAFATMAQQWTATGDANNRSLRFERRVVRLRSHAERAERPTVRAAVQAIRSNQPYVQLSTGTSL